MTAMSGSSQKLTFKKGAPGDQVWDLLCLHLASHLDVNDAPCTCMLIKNSNLDDYVHRPPDKIAELKIIFSYLLTKTYVVGPQKNRLDETVLLST